jgi:hypothetical protein
MPGDTYSVTLRYELRHTRGELVPSADEVKDSLERFIVAGDEINVHVEQEVDKLEPDGFGEEQPTGEKVRKIEGCRVGVDEVVVEEAKHAVAA